MKKSIILNIIAIIISMQLCSAAHYIVGYVNDAEDGTPANGHIIMLWNSLVGIQENLTDIIGPDGNSRTSNIYMIDCELLPSGCNIGDNLTLQIVNNGDNHVSDEKNVTVQGYGYDIVENITLGSLLNISLVDVDDELSVPPNEIDLTPAGTKEVICTGVITSYEGEEYIKNASARFFDNLDSSYDAGDDNNDHYTNDSCFIDYSYGDSREAEAICKFDVWYYANPVQWNCTIDANDNLSVHVVGSDTTSVNTLLALGLDSFVEYAMVDNGNVSSESPLNITNYGNVMINLSLSGYGAVENDGIAMNCSEGIKRNISIDYEKFNLTSSNQGYMNLSEFEEKYTNLTSYPVVKEFNLDYRKDDSTNNAKNKTYWRIYVPTGVSGTCQGNIIFGAVQAPGD